MKSKYDENTFPLLAEGYAREGLNDEEIAHNLGIKKSAFYDYQNKYSDFAEAIKRGKAPVDRKVENALLKRALGYTYEETTQIMAIKEGQPIVKEVRKVTKQIAPDIGASIFWLTNRKRDEWKNTQHIDHTSKGKPITLTDEKRKAILDEIRGE